jgi:hypothetical protein
VFTELQAASCVPAIVALVVLSFITDIFLIRTFGSNAVMLVPNPPGTAMGSLTRELVFYSLRAVLIVFNLLVIVTVFYALLFMIKSPALFDIVLMVCSYAAYARAAVKLVVTMGAVSYGFLSHATFVIVTNATVFLSETTTPKPLYFLAGLLDFPTVTFLLLVIIGLWKAVPGLRLQKSIFIVLGPWLLYAGLGYWAKR